MVYKPSRIVVMFSRIYDSHFHWMCREEAPDWACINGSAAPGQVSRKFSRGDAVGACANRLFPHREGPTHAKLTLDPASAGKQSQSELFCLAGILLWSPLSVFV